jgi:hypothetical protein
MLRKEKRSKVRAEGSLLERMPKSERAAVDQNETVDLCVLISLPQRVCEPDLQNSGVSHSVGVDYASNHACKTERNSRSSPECQ